MSETLDGAEENARLSRSRTGLESIAIGCIANVCADVIISVHSLPRSSGDHRGQTAPTRITCGGSLNCLLAVAALGVSIAPIGCLSGDENDPFAHHILRVLTTCHESAPRTQLESVGKVTLGGLLRKPGYSTPTCAVLVDGDNLHTFISSDENPSGMTYGELCASVAALTESDSISETETTIPSTTSAKPDDSDRARLASMVRVARKTTALILDGYAIAGEPVLSMAMIQHLFDEKPGSSTQQVRPSTHLWLDPQAVGSLMHDSNNGSDEGSQSKRSTNGPCHVFSIALRTAYGVSLTLSEGKALLSTVLATTTSISAGDLVKQLATSQLFPNARIILVKDGAAGCAIGHRLGKDSVLEPTAEAPHWTYCQVSSATVDDAEVRDSTGCGDAFLGAFLAGLYSASLSVEDAARLGCAAGAGTVRRPGAGEIGVASAADMMEMLQRGGPAERDLLERLFVDATTCPDSLAHDTPC